MKISKYLQDNYTAIISGQEHPSDLVLSTPYAWEIVHSMGHLKILRVGHLELVRVNDFEPHKFTISFMPPDGMGSLNQVQVYTTSDVAEALNEFIRLLVEREL